jgi:hypothetical protein
MECAPLVDAPSGIAADLILGGQNTYVKLTSTNVTKFPASGSDSVVADVTVQNLTGMPMATADGTTPDAEGVRVFIASGPTNGVTVEKNDGFAHFTHNNQPFFRYTGAGDLGDGILTLNETSAAHHWRFVTGGVTTFSFTAAISTKVPAETGILRWTALSPAPLVSGIDMWGTSPTDVYAVPSGAATTIQHFDGGTWSAVTIGASGTMRAIYGASATDIFVVGNNGGSRHFVGGIWTTPTGMNNIQINGVWGTGTTYYAVGNVFSGAGKIYKNTGANWSTQTSNTTVNMTGVWGSSATDVWAVGTAGIIDHTTNGSTWIASAPMTTGHDWTTIWGSGANDVWVGATDGTIGHWDGANWSVNFTASAGINEIYGTSASDVYAVGAGGLTLRFNGTNWFAMGSGTASALTGLYVTGDREAFAVGGTTYRHGIR